MNYKNLALVFLTSAALVSASGKQKKKKTSDVKPNVAVNPASKANTVEEVSNLGGNGTEAPHAASNTDIANADALGLNPSNEDKSVKEEVSKIGTNDPVVISTSAILDNTDNGKTDGNDLKTEEINPVVTPLQSNGDNSSRDPPAQDSTSEKKVKADSKGSTSGATDPLDNPKPAAKENEDSRNVENKDGNVKDSAKSEETDPLANPKPATNENKIKAKSELSKSDATETVVKTEEAAQNVDENSKAAKASTDSIPPVPWYKSNLVMIGGTILALASLGGGIYVLTRKSDEFDL